MDASKSGFRHRADVFRGKVECQVKRISTALPWWLGHCRASWRLRLPPLVVRKTFSRLLTIAMRMWPRFSTPHMVSIPGQISGDPIRLPYLTDVNEITAKPIAIRLGDGSVLV